MATRTFASPIVDFYGESVTTSATTLIARGVQLGADELMIWCDNKETRVQMCPAMAACLVTDDAGATFTDYTSQAKDRNTSNVVVLDSLDTAANDGYWYLASKNKFAGAWCDIGAANGTTSTMTGYYWNGSTWADVTITDGTSSSSKCLAIDGNITFSVPSAWATTTLNGKSKLYVIRFQVHAALDDEVEIDQICLLPDTTAYPGGYLTAETDYIMTVDRAKVGGVCVYQGAGDAAAVHLTWMWHTKMGDR